jgi:hypothetical protein
MSDKATFQLVDNLIRDLRAGRGCVSLHSVEPYQGQVVQVSAVHSVKFMLEHRLCESRGGH